MKFAPLFGVLFLCLGFALLFQSFLMQYVIEPIAVSLWLAWQIVASVDQGIYWALTILACSISLVRVLPPGRRKAASQARQDEQWPGTGVERWQVLLQTAGHASDGGAVLRAKLRELLGSVIGNAGESSPAELEERLASERLSLPPAVRQYLFPVPKHRRWLPTDGLGILLSGGVGLLQQWIRKPADREHAMIAELLQWMESTMEMNHGRDRDN